MKRIYSIPRFILMFLWIASAMIGCGGGGGSSSGGGGGTPPLSYSGVLSQAPIHSANAEVMATGALVGAATGAALTLSSSLPGDVKPASNHPFVLDLPKILRRSANHADWRAGGQLSVQRTESETVPGTCGGSLSYNLTVDDATGDFVGVFVFSDYCDDGITLNGRVDADGSIDLIASEFGIINFHFDNLSSADFVFAGDISLDETGPSSLIAMDSLLEDTISDKVYWFKDYVMTVTEINGVDTEIGITGVFYDPDYGYVNVSTPDPFIFVSNDEWPSSGTMLCEGSGNTTAKLIAVDSRSYRIDADTNGDTIDDYFSGVQLWADL